MAGGIRKPREEDIPYLLEIYNYEAEHGVATFDIHRKTLEEWKLWYRLHVEQDGLLVWEEPSEELSGEPAADGDIHEDKTKGRPVGYVTLSPYREREAFAVCAELSLYVHPEWRKRGIGSRLMKAMLEQAESREGLHTIVSVITGENEASIRLHERFGFVHCGRMRQVGRKFGRYLDIVNMQLMLHTENKIEKYR